MFEEEIQVVEQQEVNSLMGLVDEQISQIEWPRCTKCMVTIQEEDRAVKC